MKKVTYVKFHSTDTFLPGVGSVGDTLPSPHKSHKLEMYFDGANLFLTINGVKAITPSANIKIMTYVEEASVDFSKPISSKGLLSAV